MLDNLTASRSTNSAFKKRPVGTADVVHLNPTGRHLQFIVAFGQAETDFAHPASDTPCRISNQSADAYPSGRRQESEHV